MAKIVVLNGSPRKNGNTSALVKAFTEGAESAGNSVTDFFLTEWIYTAARDASAVAVKRNVLAFRMTV